MPRPLSEPEIAEFRDKLCNAAAGLFARHGRDGFTLRSLSAELGVSPMTPYRYFKDKDDILAAVRARAFDRFSQALEDAFAGEGPALERTMRVGDAYVRFAFAEPDSYRLMFDLTQPDEENYPDLVRAATRARRMMSEHVRNLIAEGILEGDPVVIGHVFWAAVHGAIVLQMAGKLGPDCDFAHIRDATMRALYRGFAPKDR
ncbi:MAG TPA: TetR/AcrR family transcriptional regulator [Rhizomicrobium sp.]|nr:TetR/AcrR family transcriptional regulator [Rhizomicrobium sp.]